MKYMLIVLSAMSFLLFIGWLGFQIMPKSFELDLYPESEPASSMKAKSGISSVSAYYDTVFDGEAAAIETSVVTGRAAFKIKGISMKGRFITFYKAAQGFYRYIEVTWFGIPVITGYDLYTEDQAEFCMAGKVERGERIEQGQNLALWAESVWSPSMLVFSDDIVWHEVNDRTALMQIPYKDEGDAITVIFADNGLIEKMEAMRYKGNNPVKSLWEIESIEWADVGGMTIPVKSSVKWGDESSPWAYWDIDSVKYNIPLSEGFRDEMDTYGQAGKMN